MIDGRASSNDSSYREGPPGQFAVDVSATYVRLCGAVLAVQVLVGLAGLALHVIAGHLAPAVFDKILHGAPPMAPLLFVNLSLLAWIALAAWFDAPEPQR